VNAPAAAPRIAGSADRAGARVPVLAVRELSKAFDGVQALHDVTFDVHAGERVALIGPNGAGKTTCFNVIDGQLRPDHGSVQLDGRRIDNLAPQSIAHRGVGRTFQVAATFPSMTVRENVAVALLAGARRDGALVGGIADALHDADEALERLALADLRFSHCASLAYGEAKRVELALALAQRPRLLLMDEPTAGAGAAARDAVLQVVHEVTRDAGAAVLFTEHDMDVVFAHAQRVIVLDRGSVIATGTPDDIRRDARVQKAYLGTDAPHAPHAPADTR
jgi:branched-chain amino acid transport system ATP-binding protein